MGSVLLGVLSTVLGGSDFGWSGVIVGTSGITSAVSSGPFVMSCCICVESDGVLGVTSAALGVRVTVLGVSAKIFGVCSGVFGGSAEGTGSLGKLFVCFASAEFSLLIPSDFGRGRG